MKKLLCLTLLAGFTFSVIGHSFTDYKLIAVIPNTIEHVNLLSNWQNDDAEFDIWNEARELNTPFHVLLSPKAFEYYKILFDIHEMNYKILHENIQEKIDEESESMKRPRFGKSIVGTYATHDQMNQFIEDLAAANPSYLSIYLAGKTHQNREMKVLKIKTANTKRSIWIDCGIHAREWVAHSTCIWIIDKLISEYNSGDAVTRDLLNHYEIHVLPCVNPDGYNYSMTTYRLWRKSRIAVSGSTCIGVDLNRNFNFQWMVAGASSNPCSDTFAGVAKNSELETKAVIDAVNAKRGDWDAFLTIHSYSQLMLIPYGYTTALPVDYTEQERVAKIVTAAIKSHVGTTYTIGTSGNLLYLSSGSSRDWAYGDANIKYSYTFELSPSDTGPDSSYGFVLPESQAPRVGTEIYKGVKELMLTIKN